MLMFQYSDISLKDLYETMFEFTVNNSRKMRSDALIGSFKLDVGSVYDQPGLKFQRFMQFIVKLLFGCKTNKLKFNEILCCL